MDLSGALRCAITIAKWVLASRNPNMINLPKLEEKQVAPRQIRKPVKSKSDNATDEIFPQLRQTESGRYFDPGGQADEGFLRDRRGCSICGVGDEERTSDR
jgi:hypothetical protein